MKITSLVLFILLVWTSSCTTKSDHIITSDITNFWTAYDKIRATNDTTEQARILQEEYFEKGSPGLAAIRQVRDYSEQDYLKAIQNYPRFWESIRDNTLKADDMAEALEAGIKKLKALYPELKPAKIYFTVGAFRTNGTTLDSLVLIGSELAMADPNTPVDEFPEAQRAGRKAFFETDPIGNLVLLNIHEYVHTQQKPMVHNLLSQCLYEGVAEFVSVKAMNVPSASPAVAFGKENQGRVVKKFEADMFRGNMTYLWLWSTAENEFGVRDLGYYIGYEMCERYYNAAADKQQAIKEMIELDYQDEEQIEKFVDGTGIFSASLEELFTAFESSRPTVVAITPFENGSESVSSTVNQLTVTFSEPMDVRFRNFDFGPIGEEGLVALEEFLGFSEDGKTITFRIRKLEPGKHYQLLIGNGFRNREGFPLKPYLIDFKTKRK